MSEEGENETIEKSIEVKMRKSIALILLLIKINYSFSSLFLEIVRIFLKQFSCIKVL